MATVLNERGFKIMVYTDDHDPAHVHIKKNGKYIRVILESVELMDEKSYFSSKDTKAALQLVADNLQACWDKWNEYYT